MSFRLELKQKVLSEVMACIGCNDCMIACPLPETQKVTIAELNAAIHQAKISDSGVIDFVTACTQCGQCEPVCPADLSRADMVLWNKIKVQDAAPNHQVTLHIGKGVYPSGITLQTLAGELQKHTLMENLEAADLQSLALRSSLRQLKKGEIICRAGEFHEQLFLVLKGTIVQTARGVSHQWHLKAGDSHGAHAVIANQVELFTLTSDSDDALILEIPKAPLHELMKRSSIFRSRMEAFSRRSAMTHWRYAVQSQDLYALKPEEAEELKSHAKLRVLQAGDTLCKEGETMQDIYFVHAGVLSASGSDFDRHALHEGDTIGGREVVLGKTRQALTVQAETRAEIVGIPTSKYLEALKQNPEAHKKLKAWFAPKKQTPAKKEKVSTTEENPLQPSLSWSNLLDRGIQQGYKILAIDQSRCIDCNNCVDACSRRHGHNRLSRTGLQLGHLLFASACRHCAEPVCLRCDVNGIERLRTGEIKINKDNCNGCGACAERCPYGNIQMSSRTQPEQPKFWPNLLDYLLGKSSKKESEPVPAGEERVAVKCDLCVGYKDQACVTACPVGAAFRIDPIKGFGVPPKGKR